MYKSILFLGICSSFALGSNLTVPDKKFEKIVNCYYLGGDELSDDTQQFLHTDYIDVSLCTHITYSFIRLEANASVFVDSSMVGVDGKDKNIKKFSDLRKKKPHLKTLVTLVSYEDSTMFPMRVVTNPILREKVVNNVVKFVKKYELSGLDIHCQYPIQSSADQLKNPSDKQSSVLLLKAIRERFDKEGLILSVTVSATEKIAKISYNIKEMSKYVDFINLQSYDFYVSDKAVKEVTHNTPIYPSSKENAEDRKLNIDYVVKYWISQGAPPRKLLLGTSFYGTIFILANPKKVGKGAPSLGLGAIDLIGGSPGYYETCRFLKNPEWRYLYDKEQQVPYIYKGNLIIAYDDVESIKKKAEYVKKMNLGGVYADFIGKDDFNGRCGEKFPLLKTFNRVLGYKC